MRPKTGLILLALMLMVSLARAVEIDEILNNSKRKLAPEFPSTLQWINTKEGKGLTLAEMRGKVVLLDFWTFG
jgi:cytochrome oxidase Cu insertion factor (SCO1/SenC/PrrC family)